MAALHSIRSTAVSPLPPRPASSQPAGGLRARILLPPPTSPNRLRPSDTTAPCARALCDTLPFDFPARRVINSTTMVRNNFRCRCVPLAAGRARRDRCRRRRHRRCRCRRRSAQQTGGLESALARSGRSIALCWADRFMCVWAGGRQKPQHDERHEPRPRPCLGRGMKGVLMRNDTLRRRRLPGVRFHHGRRLQRPSAAK